MINRFADLTGDHQWIHVDVERAKRESPFKGTIAHGFLTLSLLPAHAQQARRGRSRLRQRHQLRRQQAPLRLARSRRARRCSRTARLIGVEPHPKGTQVTQEIEVHVVGQREAGADLRDGGAVPSADEAGLSGPPDRRRAQPAGRTDRHVSPDRGERRGLPPRARAARQPASGRPTIRPLLEYVRVMSQCAAATGLRCQQRPAAGLGRTISSCSTWGFRPAHPSLRRSVHVHVPARRLPAPRSGTCCSSGSTATTWSTAWAGVRFLFWYLGDRRRRDALPHSGRAELRRCRWSARRARSRASSGSTSSGSRAITVRLLWLLPPFVMQVFEVPARLVLGVYLVLDNLLPYLIASGGRAAWRTARTSAASSPGSRRRGSWGGASSRRGRRSSRRRPRCRCSRSPPGAIASRPQSIRGRMEDAAVEYFEVPARASRGLLTPEHSLALGALAQRPRPRRRGARGLRRHLRDFPARSRSGGGARDRRPGVAGDAARRPRRTSTSWRRSTRRPIRRPPRRRGAGSRPSRHSRSGRSAAPTRDRLDVVGALRQTRARQKEER